MGHELEQFKATPLGQEVGLVLTSPANVMRMVTASGNGIPAVEPVGRDLLQLGPALATPEIRRLVGLWVREVMHMSGWVPAGIARVSPGNLFASGIVFTAKLRRQT
jgi:hypothetical protein